MPKTCILICTFDRPVLLQRLLSALALQAHVHDCTTIVVDNGPHSSEAIVSAFLSSLNIIYDRISERGLVIARNRAMSLALALQPQFIVFIDDDEVPEADWLANLIHRIEETGADLACGPVLPEYTEPPPRWATEGGFFEGSGDPPGTENLILRASSIPADKGQWFRPEFNLSGGEDYEFLSRLIANGAMHVVAEAAVVRETVPPSRLRRRYIWRRGLRDGVYLTQIISLKKQSWFAFAAAVLLKAGEKIGYGLNHLFWSPSAPWRLHRAIADFASAGGIILRSMGVRFEFYGQAKALQELPREDS